MNTNKISFDDRVKPKNVLALNDKVAAIRRYEADPVYKSVGRYFNCSPDQIKRIIRQKHTILAEWNNRTKKSVMPTSHELKSVKMSVLGKAVHEWIRRMMYYTDFNLTDALIQTMAIEFKKVLGLQNFFPDKSWIANFRSAYNLKEVNTKTLEIGYQESHSVQIRDILRYLNEVCGTSGTVSPAEGLPTTVDVAGAVAVQASGDIIKEEPTDDVEMKYEASTPCCSKSLTAIPSMLLPAAAVTLAPVKEEPDETAALQDEVGPTEQAQSQAITTKDEAINCVKQLEEFALLKENFRLIGLIERLEDALKQ